MSVVSVGRQRRLAYRGVTEFSHSEYTFVYAAVTGEITYIVGHMYRTIRDDAIFRFHQNVQKNHETKYSGAF